MAYIKTLKDNELIGGQDNTDVYPVSTSQAIYRQNPDGTIPPGIQHQRLEESLQDHEEDAKELHRKTEKLVAYLSNDKANQTLEITGDANTVTLTGSAQVETYGDEPAEIIAVDDMEVKKLSITSSGAIIVEDNNKIQGTYTLPNAVGSYTCRFDVTYNSIAKFAESVTNINLRKYFGFATSQPSDVTTLEVSHFSNSVACTITLTPLSGVKFKRAYFAVPNGMSITRIVQPDALNAPLAFSQIGTIERVINGTSYTYKLYQSDDLIDSTVSKRLTIS